MKSSIDRIMEMMPPDNQFGAAVEYGAVRLGWYDGKELWATITLNESDLRDFLIAEAAIHLPDGTRFEVRKQWPTNFGRSHGMAWYRDDSMDEAARWGHVPLKPEQDVERGFLLVGQYVTSRADARSVNENLPIGSIVNHVKQIP